MTEINNPVQSGVLPYRFKKGALQVLLITTSSKKEWILPKGKIENGMSPQQSALKEAFEEAGVEGNITGETIGSYSFVKKKSGMAYRVVIFPMKVETIRKKWLEKEKRDRRWCSLDEAVQMVSNPQLKELLSDSGWAK